MNLRRLLHSSDRAVLINILTAVCLSWAAGIAYGESQPVGAPIVHAATHPVGVAISWIPYNNRSDFIEDKKIIGELVEKNFFGIPAENHIHLSADASFMSFEEALEESSQQLLSLTDSQTEPYLALVIASHGDNGCLATQNVGSIPLSLLAEVLVKASEDFRQQSGRSLRLEIMYSACHSGSLIRAFRKELARTGHQGPVSILTTTNENLVSFASHYTGDYLLNWINSLGVKAREIGGETSWAIHQPTVAQFGFFNHFGRGSTNFPQVFSTDFNWSEQNTLDFLHWKRVYNTHSRSGISLWERQLELDFSSFIERESTIPEIWELLKFENWNDRLDKSPQDIVKYLRHAKQEIRYAAALFVIEAVQNKFSPQESFRPYYKEAEEMLLSFWSEPGRLTLLGRDADLLPVVIGGHLNLLETAPLPEFLELVAKLRCTRNTPINDPFILDSLRKVFVNRYQIRYTSRDDFYSPKPPAPIDLSTVPEALKYLLLKIYFHLPEETPEREILRKIRSDVANDRRSPFRMLTRPDCAKILGDQSPLDLWTSMAIRIYDSDHLNKPNQ